MSNTQETPLSSSPRPKVKVVPAAVYYERIGDVVDCCSEAMTLIEVFKNSEYEPHTKAIGQKIADIQKELRALHRVAHVTAHGAVKQPNSVFALA